MDLSTMLCLACSSSLPPRLLVSARQAINSKPVDGTLFLTRCCARPICPTCLARSPRLARYDPCLQCLGGVHAVAGARGTIKNVDGAVRDDDVYAIGDDEEEEEEEGRENHNGWDPTRTPPPPAYATDPEPTLEPKSKSSDSEGGINTDAPPSFEGAPDVVPVKYYIKPGDTLLGISLRYSVDVRAFLLLYHSAVLTHAQGRALCRLNTLPASTLSTTPHLLHTRTYLVLPPSGKSRDLPAGPAPPDIVEEARRTRERAQKRFQFVTKEVDWRVAQAYVALAEDNEAGSSGSRGPGGKEDGEKKEGMDAGSTRSEPLENRAVERYMDDEEWETQERAAGRGVCVPRFPVAGECAGTSNKASGSGGKGWWRG
jgi:hypothetical protein